VPRIKIDAVEWDDVNELHATRHGVSISEIEAVLARATVAYRNRKGRSGTTTFDKRRSGARPCRCWTLRRWNNLSSW